MQRYAVHTVFVFEGIESLRKFGTVVRRRPQSGGEKTTLLLGYRLKDVEEEFL